MPTFNSRLVNTNALKELVEMADELADLCNQLADPVCDFENAEELSGSERTEVRDDARETAWSILGEMRAQWALIEAWIVKRETTASDGFEE